MAQNSECLVWREGKKGRAEGREGRKEEGRKERREEGRKGGREDEGKKENDGERE